MAKNNNQANPSSIRSHEELKAAGLVGKRKTSNKASKVLYQAEGTSEDTRSFPAWKIPEGTVMPEGMTYDDLSDKVSDFLDKFSFKKPDGSEVTGMRAQLPPTQRLCALAAFPSLLLNFPEGGNETVFESNRKLLNQLQKELGYSNLTELQGVAPCYAKAVRERYLIPLPQGESPERKALEEALKKVSSNDEMVFLLEKSVFSFLQKGGKNEVAKATSSNEGYPLLRELGFAPFFATAFSGVAREIADLALAEAAEAAEAPQKRVVQEAPAHSSKELKSSIHKLQEELAYKEVELRLLEEQLKLLEKEEALPAFLRERLKTVPEEKREGVISSYDKLVATSLPEEEIKGIITSMMMS